jgi:hypothetical protein
MTPYEFSLAVQGYERRVEMEWQRAAWTTAHLMNMWKSKGSPITPAKLLGAAFKKRTRRAQPADEADED